MNIKILKKLDKAFPNYGSNLRNALEAGQGHIFRWWEEITFREKKHLLEQISSIDFQLVNKLFRDGLRKVKNRTEGCFVPPKVTLPPVNNFEREAEQKIKRIGEDALHRKKIAVLTVAGGQGTRLGSDVPKGTLPIAPISEKSIFQLHAEKIYAIQKRYDTYILWYIMTSETNNHATQAFFKENQFFRLDPQQISFFTQGMLPAVDMHGNLLMSSKSSIVMSPNGHGGTIIALNEKGILNDMKRRGVKEIFYHQVDNALIKIADPVFVGYHLKDGAEMSLKVVKKYHPEEKVGIVVYLNGCLQIIEYSEFSREDMYAKNDDGTLKYNAGSIAVHMINIDFLEKVYQQGETLPYHAAIKKVPYINSNGVLVNPEKDNAVKFESFIFDMLKHVKKGVIMEVLRQDEFSPVKNVEGENSPVTAKQDMVNLFGRWLCNAGVFVPIDSQGNVIGLIEINPCFALDEEELKGKINKTLKFNGFLSL